jgi:hypothetical protein
VLRIIHGLISCLESGFDATIDATGKIRKTKIIFSVVFLSSLPLAYILYTLGFPPYTIVLTFIAAEIIFLLVQTRILAVLTEFKISKYLSITILPVFLVTILIIPQYLLNRLFGGGFADVIILSAISVLLTITTIYFIGLNKEERIIIFANVKKIPVIRKLIK